MAHGQPFQTLQCVHSHFLLATALLCQTFGKDLAHKPLAKCCDIALLLHRCVLASEVIFDATSTLLPCVEAS